MIQLRRGLTAGFFVPPASIKEQADHAPHALLSIPQGFTISNPAVRVPDVSFWQDDDQTIRKIDFVKMKATGVSGVILRAGQGGWEDEDFASYWPAARAAGLPFGTYWFYDPRWDWRGQSNLWAGLVSESQPELDNWSDFEYPASWGGNFAGWRALYDFQERNLSVQIPRLSIYTGYYWWYEYVWSQTTAAQLSYFSRYPLSLAWYTSILGNVKIPQPWNNNTWRWWQYSSSEDGLAYGVERKNIDMSLFNGDEAAYRATFGLDSTTPPTNGGTVEYTGKAKLSATPNVRVRESYPLGQVISAIQPGQEFTGGPLDAAAGWMRIVTIGGKTVLSLTGKPYGWSSAQFLEYTAVDPIPDPEPPTATLPAIHISTTYSAPGYPDLTLEGDWLPNA